MQPNPAKEGWFETLVRDLEEAAFRYALWLVRDVAVAEDVLQEALTRVWHSPNTPSEPTEFKRWLYRTMANLARDQRRRRRFRAALRFTTSPLSVDPLDEVERRMGEAALAEALRSLPERERTAVYFRYLEGVPFGEVGRLLGTSEGNARVIVHRALAKLRRQLAPAEVPA